MARKYTAILELQALLIDDDIPHIMENCLDGYKITYYRTDDKGDMCEIGNVIEHRSSYGNTYNLMEAAGFGIPDVDGFLNVEDAFKYFKDAHEVTLEMIQKEEIAKCRTKLGAWADVFEYEWNRIRKAAGKSK